MVFGVKDWISKHSHGGERLRRTEKAKLQTGKPPQNQEPSGIIMNARCEYLKRQCFIPKNIGNQQEPAGLEALNDFLEDKNTYRRA